MRRFFSVAILLACCGVLKAQELYNADPMTPVVGGRNKDQSPWVSAKGATLKPVFIAGPRNGVYSGMVIYDGNLKSQASITDLKGPSGVIPALAVELRYPSRRLDLAGGERSLKGKREVFDAIASSPDPEGEIQPVLITVHIPRTAKAGQYSGILTVGSKKATVDVKVIDYLLPNPKDWDMWCSTTQSPATLAVRYGVETYSDRHFKLLAKSLALQGALGDNVLYVPILGRNMQGEEHGMIYYKQSGRTLTPVFDAFEKYLDLYINHCGKPRVVIAYVYDAYLGYVNRAKPSDRFFQRRAEQEEAGKFAYFSVIEDGKLVSRKFLRPPMFASGLKESIEGMKSVLKKRRIDPGVLRLGAASDSSAVADFVKFFQEIAPDVTWAMFTHGYGGRASNRGKPTWTDSNNGMVATYAEYPDPNTSLTVYRPGCDSTSPFVGLESVRDVHGDRGDRSLPFVFRIVPEFALDKKKDRPFMGLARMGLDLWALSPEALAKPGRKSGGVFNRYAWNQANRLYRSATYAITAPGPDGAVATLRYEMLRQGLQEAETRGRMTDKLIFLPKRIKDLGREITRAEGKRSKPRLEELRASLARVRKRLGDGTVPDDVRKRFEAMMEERAKAIYSGQRKFSKDSIVLDGKWAERTARFWSVAAEVLGSGGEQ